MTITDREHRTGGLRPIRDVLAMLPRPTKLTTDPSTGHELRLIRPDETEPDACPQCGGAGWLRRDVPLGHPEFGRLVRCECASADAQTRMLRRMVATSGLTEAMLTEMTFASFKPLGRPDLIRARAACQTFVEHPDGWLYLYGGVGTGKTHLLAAIAGTLLRRGVGAYYQVVPELLDRIRATFDREERDESFAALWERLLTADVLLLDDLGAEYPTAWVVERLYTLIDHRYRARQPTVIASNLPPERLGGRIGSRIADVRLTTVIGVAAPDYRRGERAS